MAILMAIFSEDKAKYKSRRVNTFYTSILKNIRNKKEDFVFNTNQIEYLKTLLNDNEELVIREGNDCYYINLKENEYDR